ncbi:hypothetical protein L208DRAFT_1311097 [Tricholoma matsutake]|nr:hypothetical protein L208DRAFT_1311097 [Tricholoma matsutake 945]
MQELTALSLTGTVVDRGHGSRPHFASASPEDPILSPAPPAGNFDSPQPTWSTSSVDPRIVPPTIPPTHTNRTLVLCFDGTGDQFSTYNSNIVHFVSLLRKDDKSKQMVYYQAGIGTYMSPQVATPWMVKVSRALDLMVAWDLNAHVMGGYEFLMRNYKAGDRICIFGFSRGAYTARSLAGMIHKVGLLPADNFQQVPFAYKMYTRDDVVGWQQSTAFRQAFSVKVDIEFIGVWDTVDSVGIIPKRLPFTTSNTIVRTFRHAVSLDERRAKFQVNLWKCHHDHGEKLSADGTVSPMLRRRDKDTEKEYYKRSSTGTDQDFCDIDSGKEENLTDYEEVWFPGCHGDIGGGSVRNTTRHALSRISLRWMVRECFKTNTGIMFDTQALRNIGLDPSTLYPFVTPRPPPLPVGNATLEKLRSPSMLRRFLIGIEEEEELNDALSPIHDELRLRPAWWILEVLPLTVGSQFIMPSHNFVCSPNLARPRHISSDPVKIHRTVRMRMEASYPKGYPKNKRYSPKSHINVETCYVG